MKDYVKPIVLANEELAEGVYAASGDAGNGGDCYTVTAYIHQTPELGREDYRIQVNGVHAAVGHHSTGQELILYFNQPVNYQFCNGAEATLVSGDGTSELRLAYSYHNNENDNIGLGDVVVTSGDGLAVSGAVLKCNYTCGQHDSLGNY